MDVSNNHDALLALRADFARVTDILLPMAQRDVEHFRGSENQWMMSHNKRRARRQYEDARKARDSLLLLQGDLHLLLVRAGDAAWLESEHGIVPPVDDPDFIRACMVRAHRDGALCDAGTIQ